MPHAASDPLIHVLSVVQTNLEHQADWSALERHLPPAHPRPLLTGLPPSPIYLDDGEAPTAAHQEQREWVVPINLRERWSVHKSADVFDSIPAGCWGVDKTGKERKKRVVLACVGADSTVVYYVMHDGIVKPRQN